MSETANTSELQFGYWFVAFFDLLGIRERYLETDYLPTNDEEKTALIKKLKNGVGAVQALRRNLTQFEEALTDTSDDDRLDSLPTAARELVKNLRKTRAIRANVSDAILLACPLASSSENFPIRGIYDAIHKSASMMLMSLAGGQPVRGGLDVGTAILDGDELFGAALVKAYVLESKCAEYPRLVVGDSLVEYLVQQRRSPADGVRGKIERQIAERLLSFLVRDDFDQRWILDYAGTAFRESVGNVPGLDGLLKGALAFAVRSRDEFAARHDEKGSKLVARYKALVRYLERSKSV